MYRWHLIERWRGFQYLVLASSFVAIGLACGGCNDTSTKVLDPSKGYLSGKITYQGKPFPGYIIVQSEDNHNTAKGTLTSDGSYVIPGIPIGKAKVGLVSPPHSRRRPTPEKQDSEIKKPNMIPSKYNDPTTSGLTVEIQPGRNQYSVDLP